MVDEDTQTKEPVCQFYDNCKLLERRIITPGSMNGMPSFCEASGIVYGAPARDSSIACPYAEALWRLDVCQNDLRKARSGLSE